MALTDRRLTLTIGVNVKGMEALTRLRQDLEQIERLHGRFEETAELARHIAESYDAYLGRTTQGPRAPYVTAPPTRAGEAVSDRQGPYIHPPVAVHQTPGPPPCNDPGWRPAERGGDADLYAYISSPHCAPWPETIRAYRWNNAGTLEVLRDDSRDPARKGEPHGAS